MLVGSTPLKVPPLQSCTRRGAKQQGCEEGRWLQREGHCGAVGGPGAALQADSLPAKPQGEPKSTGVGSLVQFQGMPWPRGWRPGLMGRYKGVVGRHLQ